MPPGHFTFRFRTNDALIQCTYIRLATSNPFELKRALDGVAVQAAPLTAYARRFEEQSDAGPHLPCRTCGFALECERRDEIAVRYLEHRLWRARKARLCETRLNAVSLGFTVAAIVFVLFALSAVVVIPLVLQHLLLSNATDLLVRLARWPAMFVGLALALACIYRFGPSREAPRWRWITWGSVAATMLWLIASALFFWYAGSFGKFNETYGSLGAAIGFMTWLWISAIVILLGGELDAEMEHQTTRDTTTGAPKPMGVRGARMADTVGAARSEG